MTTKELQQIFAIRILERLEFLGMSQSDLSRKSGVSPGLISHYLHRRCIPSIIHVLNISTALGVSAAWMVGVGEKVELKELGGLIRD